MEFFNGIKKKMMHSDMLFALLFAVLSVGMLIMVVNTGFSSDTDFNIGLRGTGIGIPVPNWLLSVIFIIMMLLFAIFCVSGVRSLIKGQAFKQLMDDAMILGKLSDIGDELSKLENIKDASGMLRADKKYIFYLNSGVASIIYTKTVITLTHIKVNNESRIRVDYLGGSFDIAVKKNAEKLISELQSLIAQ